MSHVDEGTLHAYLDGELPSSERAAADAHLAQCAACRAMLADERALVERASALLNAARPLERPAPPFEQLRRSPRRSPWHVRTPFAWAASITVALGLGYYLRDLGMPASFRTAPPQAVVIAEDRAMADDRAPAPAPPPRLHRDESAPRRQSQRAQQPEPRTEIAQATENAKVESLLRVDSVASGYYALEPKAQLRGATPAQAAAAAPLRDSAAALSELTIVGARAERERDLAAARGRAATTQWQIISRGAATSLLGTDPVGLPGLATRRIRRSPAPDGTVVVEQALDSSTVIQIFQRPAGSPSYLVDGTPVRQAARDRAAREAVPAAPTGAPAPAERLARFVGRLRVEISGPLSQDSLNRLLEQVEPLP